MAIVSGTVDATSNKFGKFSICVDEKWYGTKFPPSPAPARGDQVEFDDGGKNFINKLKVVSSGGGAPASAPSTGGGMKYRGSGFPVDPLDGSRAIIRQNALTNARELVQSLAPKVSYDEQVELIIDIASKFERYSAGDIDREEAEKFKAEAS